MTRMRISCIISLFYPVCLTQHQRVVTLGRFETKHKWIYTQNHTDTQAHTHNAQQMQTILYHPSQRKNDQNSIKQWYLPNDMHRKVQVEWEKGTGLATSCALEIPGFSLLDPRVLPACCQRSFLQRCSTRPQAGVAEHIAKQRPQQRPEFIEAQSTETSFFSHWGEWSELGNIGHHSKADHEYHDS